MADGASLQASRCGVCAVPLLYPMSPHPVSSLIISTKLVGVADAADTARSSAAGMTTIWSPTPSYAKQYIAARQFQKSPIQIDEFGT